MKIKSHFFAIAAAIFTIMLLSACEANNAEDVGESIDDAARDTGNYIEDKCEDVKEALEAEDEDC